ncbi:hypothetical protein L6R49_01595 [Myxococcota bacterium]|nr:hypothetical protein [Myxococcota bacterium]
MTRAAWMAALALLAGLTAWDHVQWAAADRWPLAWGDSGLHTLSSVRAADLATRRPAPLALNLLYAPSYYPHLADWQSILWQRWLGPSPELARASQASFAAALTVGVGLTTARLWGRALGLAAAAMVMMSPLLWAQRAEAMLDGPLAGMLALSLGVLPLPGAGPVAVALGGLVMGLTLLTKQTALFFIPPFALWLVVLWGRLGVRSLWAPALWLAVVAAVAAPWLVPSLGYLRDVLQNVNAQHQLPTGEALWGWRLSWAAFVKEGLTPAPLAWGLGAGLLVAPLLRREAPLLGALLLGFAAGLIGLVSFPDAHERHFAALWPFVLPLALAPLAALRRWPRALGGLCAALVVLGLVGQLGWRAPGLALSRAQINRDPVMRDRRPETTLRGGLTRLTYAPSRWAWAAPLPRAAEWPSRALVARVLSLARPAGPRGPTVLTFEAGLSPDLLAAEAQALGRVDLKAQHVEAHQLADRLQSQRDQLSRPVWAAEVQHPQDPLGVTAALDKLGFEVVETWPARLGPNAEPVTLVLRRSDLN